MITALLLTAALSTTPAPGPGPQLHDALRMAIAVRYHDAATWNAALPENQPTRSPVPSSAGPRGTTHQTNPPSHWDSVAQCESGQDWTANTGNGFFGGLQFTIPTWLGAGGGRYAPRADLATREQQITIASTLDRSNWPRCG